jgi:hypothetical protein
VVAPAAAFTHHRTALVDVDNVAADGAIAATTHADVAASPHMLLQLLDFLALLPMPLLLLLLLLLLLSLLRVSQTSRQQL